MNISKVSFGSFSEKMTKRMSPLNYNCENATLDEFRSYINYLAKNKINKTFHEPDNFITEKQRKENDEFKKYIKYLADTKSNKTIYV